jgi:hypothetical protein
MSDQSNESLGFGAQRAPSTFQGSSLLDSDFITTSSGNSDLGTTRIAAPAVPLGVPPVARTMAELLGPEQAAALNSALLVPDPRTLTMPVEPAPKRQTSNERTQIQRYPTPNPRQSSRDSRVLQNRSIPRSSGQELPRGRAPAYDSGQNAESELDRMIAEEQAEQRRSRARGADGTLTPGRFTELQGPPAALQGPSAAVENRVLGPRGATFGIAPGLTPFRPVPTGTIPPVPKVTASYIRPPGPAAGASNSTPKAPYVCLSQYRSLFPDGIIPEGFVPPAEVRNPNEPRPVTVPAPIVTPQWQPPPPCTSCVELSNKLSALERKHYAFSPDPNGKITELERALGSVTEDKDALRVYLAESNRTAELLREQLRLYDLRMGDFATDIEHRKADYATLAYEHQESQDRLRLADEKWNHDNDRATVQFQGFRDQLHTSQVQYQEEFTRVTAAHVRALTDLEDSHALFIQTAQLSDQKLTEANTQMGFEIKTLRGNLEQSTSDREDIATTLLENEKVIENLRATITFAGDLDSTDLVELRMRVAEATVTLTDAQAKNVVLEASIAEQSAAAVTLEVARMTADNQSNALREKSITERTLIEELRRKVSASEAECTKLTADLDIASRARSAPRGNGENPDVMALVSINSKLLGRFQDLGHEIAAMKQQLLDRHEQASDVIMAWSLSHNEQEKSILRLENDLTDHKREAESRAASPERPARVGGGSRPPVRK